MKKIVLLILALFANFKAKTWTKRLKRRKLYFIHVSYKSHYTSISGLGCSTLSKKVKIVVPYCTCSYLGSIMVNFPASITMHRNENPNVCIPFLGVAWASVPISNIHVSVSNGNMGIWECTNPSQTHECGNWDCGRAIPFLGIFVSNFRFCFFAVCPLYNPPRRPTQA